ncbi:MAG: helix-turn-helix transcriptional regulator [Clostridia bacterium]|nr:helix-turn-helix transcriptional regulator [Clostridia bacterium]
MDYKLLGMKIRLFRRKQGLTQEQLAERTELSASFISHIERGNRISSLETVMKLCHVLQVTPNDLLQEEKLLSELTLPEQISLSPRELLQAIALLLAGQEKP